jgi:glycosyltransferase involved in cell wall biosynthesis
MVAVKRSRKRAGKDQAAPPGRKRNHKPIVMISSYPPRLCGIGTFCEEAREFIQKEFPRRQVLVISHTDGRGDGVFPLIDMSRHDWWRPVVDKVRKLDPYAIHIEHEYGLYNYYDERGMADRNAGFLELLGQLEPWPVVLEPHTVHGRLSDWEADFLYQACARADVVLMKCHYQKWRFDWTCTSYGWETPRNVMVVPHGARSDRRYRIDQVPELRKELGLDDKLARHVVGLVGWIQNNKRWDVLTSMWEEIAAELLARTGKEWDLLAAGEMRDPAHKPDYEKYRKGVELLEQKGLAHFYEFTPRGVPYYKIMAICDFIVLPSIDETQSGTLARIIALNKPYVTTAPMEGLTAQTIESGGGLMFTNRQMLRDAVVRLATDRDLRLQLGNNLHEYLLNVVAWEVIVRQYAQAYRLANEGVRNKQKIELPLEF